MCYCWFQLCQQVAIVLSQNEDLCINHWLQHSDLDKSLVWPGGREFYEVFLSNILISSDELTPPK